MSSPFRGSPFLTYNNRRGGLSPNSVNINKQNSPSPISIRSIYQSKIKKLEPASPTISSDNDETKESPEVKREKAEDILRRSDLRQKMKMKEKLETQIDKDIRLMKEESEKLSEERLKALSKQEQEHVEYVKKMFSDLEKVYYERNQRKIRLLNKLFYLKGKTIFTQLATLLAKQMMNRIAFESNIEENIISTDEILEISNQKTRAWMTNIVEENSHSLKGDFIYKFEAFTRITPVEEQKELKESIFKYVSPVVEKKKRDSHVARKTHYQSIKACKERVLNAFSRNIKNKYERQFEDRYNEKVQQISMGKEAVQLAPDEIIEFLEADVEDYETDIGVIDAEIDRINNEINEWKEKIEMKREYHQKQKASIQSQIDFVTESNQNLLSSINKLRKQQLSVKLADTKFVESVGGTLLSELIEKTHRIQKHDIPRLKQLSSTIEDEILALERVILEKETEFNTLSEKMKSEEESMNTISKRISILGVRLYQHEKNIKVLEENKIRAQNECEKIRASLVNLRKEAPMRQLSLIADNYALKEMSKSVEMNTKVFSQDLAKYRENNEMIMDFLKERTLRLQELCEYNQQKVRKLIKYSGSLLSVCSSNSSLEHSIVTIYQEELENTIDKYKETLNSKSLEAVGKSMIAMDFNRRAREGAIIYKISNDFFENDLRVYQTGVDDPKLDKKNLSESMQRQFTKEARLLLLLNFLLEITGLNQEYILPDGVHPSHSSVLDMVRNKNFHDANGGSVSDPPKVKNENSSFLDNKIYGEINTIFINSIENQTVVEKHDILGRIDHLQELICKKEGVNMNELEEKLQKKLVLVQREKERAAGLQKELERIEKKNMETFNTSEREVRLRVNSLPMLSSSGSAFFDEETNKIVAEERQIRKRYSSFSPSSLISKIESAKSTTQNQN